MIIHNSRRVVLSLHPYLTLDSQQFLHGSADFSLTGYVQENY